MFHQLVSELCSLLLQIFRVVKKAMISWKRQMEPSISSHKHLKDVKLEMKVQSKIFMQEVVTNGDISKLKEGDKAAYKVRKRPTMIVVPQADIGPALVEAGRETKRFEEKDVDVDDSGYCTVSRRGMRRHVMEDGYQVVTNINGDSKHAFFGVFDRHGGRWQLTLSQICSTCLKQAFSILCLNVRSGACVTTVLLNNGELYASNVGDCRTVLSRKRVATALTRDHCAGSEDERNRIESSGGYVTCHNGVWRLHDTLAVSRAIGDARMKKWVIAEPETKRLQLTHDCEFLIMASDGLWDKISNQEAVDVVVSHVNSRIESCKTLVDLAISRGSRDDITIMLLICRDLYDSKSRKPSNSQLWFIRHSDVWFVDRSGLESSDGV